MENTLQERLEHIRAKIELSCESTGRKTDSVRLIAVTKNHPASVIQELIDLKVQEIGENRVQEIITKKPALHGSFQLHMVGHLQTNKVASVLPHVQWIQSIDRIQLIEKIEQHQIAAKTTNVLIEVNTSGEESKSGCIPDECRALCERITSSPALILKGLMTIGPLGGTEKDIRTSFALLRLLSEKITDLCPTPELSMGMSGDFGWAIEEGSTMVRIGTALIGGRGT